MMFSMIAAAIPIWLILLTAVVFVLVLFGGGGGAHALRKLLVFILTAGGVLAVLALVVYPLRQSHRNVYTPAEVSVPYEAASVYIDDTTMQATASDGVTATMQVAGPSVSSGEPAAWAKVLIIVVPALSALAALAAVRRSSSAAPRHGNGLLWLAAGIAALVLLGFVFTGRMDRAASTVQGINTYSDPPLAPAPPADRAPIEEQWDRLTSPRIALEEPAAVPRTQAATREELQNAAEAIQVASEKMAESASQGWLLTAVKAIINTPSHTAPPQAASAAMTPEPAQPSAEASSGPVDSTDPAAQPQPAPKIQAASLAPPTPDWVLRPPGLVGNVRKVVVSAGPYKTLDECHRELERQMRDVVTQRVAELARAAAGHYVYSPELDWLNIGTDYILRELCTEPEYIEDVDASFGPMKKAHLLLEFTAAQDAELLKRWKTFARRDRLAIAGLGGAFVVGCLALAFGLLKVDTWTRGYYSKRLFLGVPAAIIGVVWLLWFLG